MTPRYRHRLYYLTVLILVGCGVLLNRLHEMQILNQESYREKLPQNYTVKVREPGIRGEITDRNGIVMAKNLKNYEVVFNLEEIYQDYLANNDTTLTTPHSKDGAPAKTSRINIAQIVQEWVIPRLESHGLQAKFNSRAMNSHFLTHRGLVPYTFRTDLTYEQFAHFAEHNLELPGVSVSVTPQRQYAFGSLASHILGYIKPWAKGDIPPEYKHYIGEPKGDTGVEAVMNTYLKGPEGIQTILKDEKGKTIGITDYQKPGIGSKVQLTIDAHIQHLTETVLRRAGRGAAVVMDPRTGEVLAMASVPDFDPNDFIPSISVEKNDQYRKNFASPFTNRSISKMAPGSTFKLPIAIAAAMHGKMDYYSTCPGYVLYGKQKIRCWKAHGHGTLGMSESIQRSCNPYFMKLANQLGTNKVVEVMELLGMGQPTGIRLPHESSGTVPGSQEWQRKFRNQRMTPALTGMMAIGQGYAEATPLQVAALVSAIANGGRYYKPRIIRKVTHPEHDEQISDTPILQQDLLTQGLSPSDLATIKQGMWKVVNQVGGTGRKTALDDIEIAGKTGTAQTTDQGIRSHVSWTVSFAPYESPRYAVVVAVQRGGSGGSVAGPLVKMIYNGLFAAEQGKELPLKPMIPYVGNFGLISGISLPTETDLLKATFSSDGSEDNEEHLKNKIVVQHLSPEEYPDNFYENYSNLHPNGRRPPKAVPITE